AWLEWATRQEYIEVRYPTVYQNLSARLDVYTQAMRALWEELRSCVILAYGATRNLSDFVDSRYSHLSPDARRVMTLFDPLTQVTSAEFLLVKPITEKTPLLRL